MTVMGAELSAAVRPVTRVPVTITASVSACASSCANDGAAAAVRTSIDVPKRRDDLDLERSDIREPPGCFALAKLVWFLPAHFPLTEVFCAVRHILLRLWRSARRRKSDSLRGFVTDWRS